MFGLFVVYHFATNCIITCCLGIVNEDTYSKLPGGE